jgi:hypothetical protein
MSTKQYTIRNVPQPVDRYLRKRAKISGKSLNQVIIDELSEKAGVGKVNLIDSLDWFIGSGIDQATLDALENEDRIQKQLAEREFKKLDDIT